MIVKVPNEILTTPAKRVKKLDKEVKRVVSKLKKDLLGADKPKGVGLAAPQIGIPLQIFITKPDKNTKVRIFINPKILSKSGKTDYLKRPNKATLTKAGKKRLEGCLSIPNVWGHLKRPNKVKLKYTDIKGKIHTEEFSGFMATIVQHETDHLKGILFTQKVLKQKEKLYRIEKDNQGEERLVEIEI